MGKEASEGASVLLEMKAGLQEAWEFPLTETARLELNRHCLQPSGCHSHLRGLSSEELLGWRMLRCFGVVSLPQ